MTTILMRAMVIGAVAIGGIASETLPVSANTQPPPISHGVVPPQPRQTNPLVNSQMRAKVVDHSGVFLFEIIWRFAADKTCGGVEVRGTRKTKRTGRWNGEASIGAFLITESTPGRVWRGRYEILSPTGGPAEGDVADSAGHEIGTFKGIVSLPK